MLEINGAEGEAGAAYSVLACGKRFVTGLSHETERDRVRRN